MYLFTKSLFLTVFCFIIITAPAQTIQTLAKPNAEVNYDRLTRINDLMNQFIQQQKMVGAVTLIVKDGQIIQHKAYGLDDVDSKKPLDKNAIFRIASQTKAITSVGIMILMEEGKLLLSDPISKYIPEFKNPVVIDKFNEKDSTYTTIPAKREITIKDLLTHTSGIDYPYIGSRSMQAIYAKNQISGGIGETKAMLAESMKRLGKLPLAHQPGERWTYSLSTDVLGYVIEVVTGGSLDAFFQKRIFQPLGMKDSYFNLPTEKHNRLTTLYTEDSLHHPIKFASMLGTSSDYPKQKTNYFSGGAGLSSTAMDYAIFLQMLLNKGTYNGFTLLSPRSVEMMTSNQIGKLWGDGKFGLGFSIVSETATDDMRSPGSFSWGGIFGTSYWADPKENMVCLVMTQQFPSIYWDELQNRFQVAVYQSLK